MVYSKTVAFLKSTIHIDFAVWVSLEMCKFVCTTVIALNSSWVLQYSVETVSQGAFIILSLKLLTACAMSAAFDITVLNILLHSCLAFQRMQRHPHHYVHASVQKNYTDVHELSSVDRNLFVHLHVAGICMQNRRPLKAQIVVHQLLSTGLLPSCRCRVACFPVKGSCLVVAG